jgi:hypothetical protein
MEPLEATTHSFIIRIWLEEEGSSDRRAGWRGSITHVPDGRCHVLDRLGDIQSFIGPYLEKMGVRPGAATRLWRWLRGRR